MSATIRIETTQAAKDGRWYAAAMQGTREVIGAGWYDTEAEAVGALLAIGNGITAAAMALSFVCPSCGERRPLTDAGSCAPCLESDRRAA